MNKDLEFNIILGELKSTKIDDGDFWGYGYKMGIPYDINYEGIYMYITIDGETRKYLR